jgi:hypothetical protein
MWADNRCFAQSTPVRLATLTSPLPSCMIKESMLIIPPPLASNIGGVTLPFRHNPMKKVPSMTINKTKARTYRLRRKYPNPGTNHPPIISRSTIYLISYLESPKADKYGSLLNSHIITRISL